VVGLPSLYDELSLTDQTEVEETKEERKKTERGSGTAYIRTRKEGKGKREREMK
jgi:hypothetical protein